jgi:hypothetical protein
VLAELELDVERLGRHQPEECGHQEHEVRGVSSGHEDRESYGAGQRQAHEGDGPRTGEQRTSLHWDLLLGHSNLFPAGRWAATRLTVMKPSHGLFVEEHGSALPSKRVRAAGRVTGCPETGLC